MTTVALCKLEGSVAGKGEIAIAADGLVGIGFNRSQNATKVFALEPTEPGLSLVVGYSADDFNIAHEAHRILRNVWDRTTQIGADGKIEWATTIELARAWVREMWRSEFVKGHKLHAVMGGSDGQIVLLSPEPLGVDLVEGGLAAVGFGDWYALGSMLRDREMMIAQFKMSGEMTMPEPAKWVAERGVLAAAHFTPYTNENVTVVKIGYVEKAMPAEVGAGPGPADRPFTGK